MKPETWTVKEIFGREVQWIVPVYQREYVWGTEDPKKSRESQVIRLWEDIRDKAMEKIENRAPIPHYFGAIICSPSDMDEQRNGGAWNKEHSRGKISKYHIIDGQQRITSSQLVLMALKEVAKSKAPHFIQKDIDAYVFNNIDKEGGSFRDESFKIVPSQRDRGIYLNMATKSFTDLRETTWRERFRPKSGKPTKDAEKLIRAYWALQEKIKDFVKERKEEGDSSEEVLSALFEGFLDGFKFVIIELDEEDDAQGIFASLNDLGKPLSPFDLIRNDIFLRARDKIDQNRLYEKHWSFFNEDEDFWGREASRGRIKAHHQEHFMGHAVIAETGRNINISRIATEYRRYVMERGFGSVVDELDLLRKHAENYKLLEQYKSRDRNILTDIARVLDMWDLSSFHPLVMWTNSREHISTDEKKSIFNLIETYLVRREICGLRTNYNQIAPPMIHTMIEAEKTNLSALRGLQKHLDQLQGDTRKIPVDSAVREAFGNSLGAYRPHLWRYVFLEIEYKKRSRFSEKAEVEEDDLQVEHVMPQRWAKNWPLHDGTVAPVESIYENEAMDLSPDVRKMMAEREKAVQSPGNLTLLTASLNASVSNHGWEEKKQLIGEHSYLRLNKEITSKEKWGEEEIRKRGQDLAEVTLERWPFGIA